MKHLLLSLSLSFFSTVALATYFPDKNWELSNASQENVNELRLQALEDIAFKDPATQALVVVKNGKIISERYAENYNQDSFGTSWSVAKSFYAALIGISIEKGEIDSLDDPVFKYLPVYKNFLQLTMRYPKNLDCNFQHIAHL